MPEMNPDLYKNGDPFGPTGRVTAIFGSINDLKATLTAVNSAGFKSGDTAVFMGSEGVSQLDGSGEIRGIEGLKVFQNAVCDEGPLFEEFEQALKRGEAVVAIAVENDEAIKTALVAVLKSHHARKINFWGNWHNERLG